jgi:hypothetical protein
LNILGGIYIYIYNPTLPTTASEFLKFSLLVHKVGSSQPNKKNNNIIMQQWDVANVPVFGLLFLPEPKLIKQVTIYTEHKHAYINRSTTQKEVCPGSSPILVETCFFLAHCILVQVQIKP